MQIKTFTAWVNSHLKREGLEVSDLSKDFSDGVKLIKLVEVISEETLGKYKQKPTNKFDKVNNLNLPLKYINEFLKGLGIRNSYSAENVLDENITLILGMVWSLILRFNVQQISEGDRTAKEGLLLWAQNKVNEVSKGTIEITNFHTSWQDGMGFNALIQAYRPDLVDISKLSKINKQSNLNQAFDVAETHIGIPKMLDAADMVAVRPDEKSVMTYISFFWKEFAANKRKQIAAVRIRDAVVREQNYESLITRYEDLARGMITWLDETHATFSSDVELGSIEEAETALRAYVEYGREGKPTRFKDMLEAEMVAESIKSRLATLSRTYTPPEELALESMQRRWGELHTLEAGYEESLKNKVHLLKKVRTISKALHSKASALEDFCRSKGVWLQVKTESCRGQMMEAASKYEAAAAARAEKGFESLPELMPEDFTALPPGSPRSSIDESANVTPQKRRSTRSIVSSLFSALKPRASRQSLAGSPSSPSSPKISKQGTFSLEEAMEAARASVAEEPPLDSVASVQAKLNMALAVDEEMKARTQGVQIINDLLDKLRGLLPHSAPEEAERLETIEKSFGKIELMCAEYKQVLHVAMAHHEKQEASRLAFAKWTETLHRELEDMSEALTEATSDADAEEQIAALDALKAKLEQSRGQVAALAFYAAELEGLGVTSNPYTRFSVSEIEAALLKCGEELSAREAALLELKQRAEDIDSQKKEFAAAADSVILFLKGEKQALEASTPAITINAEEPETIKRGKQIVEALREYAAAAGSRKAQLDAAQALSDTLFTAGELDNPYTRETMASLTSQLDLLEQLVSDKQIFVESQITAAEVEMSPEQRAEAEKAFRFFDKSGDGFLNMDEFTAAIKSMDFENPDQEMHDFFAANSRAEGEKTILDADAFRRFLGGQYKSKDTKDGLLEAFNVISNGKEQVAPHEVSAILPEAQANYLLPKLESAGQAFLPFANFVYGVQ